ncbi:MAG: hypothetical protein IJ088_02495 [Clostridia bacterium]|nr:hypothetical protein [Clostridia bacterium]
MKDADNCMKITLKSGVELQVDRSFMDDMELLDDLMAADRGDGMAISRILDRILDKDNKKALYDSLRENGRVKVSRVVSAFLEILETAGGEAGKN